jgi:hypothetical protein
MESNKINKVCSAVDVRCSNMELLTAATEVLGAGAAQSVQCLRTGRPGSRGSAPAEGKIFPVASASRTALRPSQSPIQWVLAVLSLAVKCSWGMMLTTSPSSAKVRNK